jgi:hypothetical protein
MHIRAHGGADHLADGLLRFAPSGRPSTGRRSPQSSEKRQGPCRTAGESAATTLRSNLYAERSARRLPFGCGWSLAGAAPISRMNARLNADSEP